MATIHFYFDFVSPYAYLAHQELPQVAARHGAEIAFHAIDLNAAKAAAGNTAPPTAAIPAKLAYVMQDFARWCSRYGCKLEFSREGPPVTAPANKGLLHAADRGVAGEYVAAMWQATFGSGGLHGKPEVLRSVATQMGWDADDFLAFVTSPEAEARYAEVNAAAQAAGVFGAPIMVVGDAMFWGNDRLDFLDEHLAGVAA